MVLEHELKKYDCNISYERLMAFKYSQEDTMEDIFNRYTNNIIISQALYPELSVLEIALRNAINNALKNCISETWLEDEYKNKKWLRQSDYETLKKAYETTKKECSRSNGKKNFTIGKVIANLNFGFWTSLCVKTYNGKIWNRKCCFKQIFPNYSAKQFTIGKISQQLDQIRRLRNRVFHYEQIIKNPQKTLELYNNIIQILSYLPGDNEKLLKNTSTFIEVYSSLYK